MDWADTSSGPPDPKGARRPSRDSRWQTGVILVLLAVAVLCRSTFFLAYDESYFDSDQAIVGLMARHLSEGRAWPLFFYGQEYMLAVEAWLMAPVFLLLGPTVFALRLTMVGLNVATGVLLWWLLAREAGLGRWWAALAATPFVLAPFITGAHLIEAQGGNVEPFLWVLIAWWVRGRPIVLGMVLAVGFLNREFTAYAAPALLLVQAVAARGRVRPLARPWATTAAAFVLVYAVVGALKPYADVLGPGTAGSRVSDGASSPLSLLLARASIDVWAWPARFHEMATDYLPLLLGLGGFRPSLISIASTAHVGWGELLPIAVPLGLAVVVWLARDVIRGARTPRAWCFPTYLVAVGLQAAVLYPLTRDLTMFTFRYGLLALLLPMGVTALALQPGRPVGLRVVTGALVGLLAAASLVDHLSVLDRSRIEPPRRRFATLAARLEANGIRYGRAGYWRAYAVTFLASERVILTSTDLRRIRLYDELVDAAGPDAVRVQERPCESGVLIEQVGDFHICR